MTVRTIYYICVPEVVAAVSIAVLFI